MNTQANITNTIYFFRLNQEINLSNKLEAEKRKEYKRKWRKVKEEYYAKHKQARYNYLLED